MSWRSIIIANPARLSTKNNSLIVKQGDEAVHVPLEDIAVIVIDHFQITLTAPLLMDCSRRNIPIITVDETHTPNGVLLSFLKHSRSLKIMRIQLAVKLPQQKRIWQIIIRQKLFNQAQTIGLTGNQKIQKRLESLASSVRSGDPDNLESQGAMLYFQHLFYDGYTRSLPCFYNAALNYGYMVIRSAIAKSLVAHGLMPAFGIHHCNELNAFNLADDLIEPYRPILDLWIIRHFPIEPDRSLTPKDKATIVSVLHTDLPRLINHKKQGESTLLSLIDATVISLNQRFQASKTHLVLPGVPENE